MTDYDLVTRTSVAPLENETTIGIRVHQPLENAFLKVKTDGTVENLFDAFECLEYQPADKSEKRSMSSRQFSVWTALMNEKIWHNGYAGYLFVPSLYTYWR